MGFIKNKKGQGLIEYIVIVALMAIASMVVMRKLSQTTTGKLAQITQALQGGKSNTDINFENIKATDVKKKDMEDFFQGSRSQRD